MLGWIPHPPLEGCFRFFSQDFSASGAAGQAVGAQGAGLKGPHDPDSGCPPMTSRLDGQP